jgi:predicted  nucleic acid-binding Zn-ribbon protein
MSVARELYKLQGIDQELAANERSRTRILEQLADDSEIKATQAELDTVKTELDGYNHQQHTLEWETDDLSSKIAKFEEQLYSGKTTSPKELAGFQQEIDNLKSQRSKLEDTDLELMESIEQVTGTISGLESRLSELQKTREEANKQLTSELKETESAIAGLQDRRQALAATFEPQVSTMYETLKKQRGTAVAKVERGICSGCRISLPVNELQQVRGGNLVRCGSCGRILFLDQ